MCVCVHECQRTWAALVQIGTGRVGNRANAASAFATAMLAICARVCECEKSPMKNKEGTTKKQAMKATKTMFVLSPDFARETQN